MSKARGSRKRYLRYAAIVLLVVLLALMALLLLDHWEKQQGVFPTQGTDELQSTVHYNGQYYTLKDNVETFLILGLDTTEDQTDDSGYHNDRQADFVTLLVIDNENSSCTAIQINRDTMAEMNILGVAGEKVGTVTKQIALAHTYGNGREVSCRNTADAVSKLFSGVKIKHYLSLTMDAVPLLNDQVGGVEVTVLDDFSGIDDTLVEGETVTLMGEHALNYVRTRYGLEDSSNEHRMVRQRQYFKALSEKAKQRAAADEEFIVDTSVKMADYLVSDCTVTQLQTLFEKFAAYDFSGITPIKGESTAGEKFMEFRPDKDALEKLIIETFYEPKA